LKLGFDAFTFRMKPETHQMELADTVRVEVAVQYKTRSWQTVEIDLGPIKLRKSSMPAPVLRKKTGHAMYWIFSYWTCSARSIVGGRSHLRNEFSRSVPRILFLLIQGSPWSGGRNWKA